MKSATGVLPSSQKKSRICIKITTKTTKKRGYQINFCNSVIQIAVF